MKKISFKGISESLMQRELKNITGGSGGSGIICFKCGNGSNYECYCPTSDYNNCLDSLADECPGGWIEWESGVNGPTCD